MKGIVYFAGNRFAMAESKDNLFTKNLSGSVGSDVVYKTINGKTYATKYPDRSKVQYNEEQLKYRELFAEASAYASLVKADPVQCAAYFRRGVGKEQIFHAAIKDYISMRVPKKPAKAVNKNAFEYLSRYPDLPVRQRKALQHLLIDGRLTNSIYQEINSVSKATATRELRSLVELKAILPSGIKGAGASYRIVK